MPRRKQGLLRGNRKDQLFLHQRHALDHYASHRLGPLAGACRGFPNPPTSWTLVCPICTRDTPYADLTEEHAPPRSAASALGGNRTVVLTCRACNSSASHEFEATAAAAANFGEALAEMPTCEVHGPAVGERRHSGIVSVIGELPYVLTDLKASYLLAFAGLGYRWALSPELDGIRSAIQQSVLPDAATFGLMQLDVPASLTSSDLIIEVSAPNPCTVVRSRNGVAAVLPSPGTAAAGPIGGTVTMRSRGWPATNGTHTQVDLEHRGGRLFHADFCSGHTWES